MALTKLLCNWLEDELKTNTDISSKEDETRLYVKVKEENGEDQEGEIWEDYYCIFEKLNRPTRLS